MAFIATTFVGFSTIFASLREGLGGKVTKYDVLLTTNILQLGFMVILGCLLPPLLSLLGVPLGATARGSSLVTALPVLVFTATYPSRRRAATGRPAPMKVWLDLGLVYIAAAVLLANVAGTPIRSDLAVHALGLTILLFAVFLAFLFGLDLLPSEPARPVSREGKSR